MPERKRDNRHIEIGIHGTRNAALQEVIQFFSKIDDPLSWFACGHEIDR